MQSFAAVRVLIRVAAAGTCNVSCIDAHVSPIEPFLWPRLSVAAAVLPVVRRELVTALDAARVGYSAPPVEVCAIVEDGVFGYELAPQGVDAPFLVVGCAEDGIPRVRRTCIDPALAPGLRLATLHGRA